MELPSDKPNEEEKSYKLYRVFVNKSAIFTINARSESEAIEEAVIKLNDIEPEARITEIGDEL